MFILNAVLQLITTLHNLLETMNPFESFVTYFTRISCMSHASSLYMTCLLVDVIPGIPVIVSALL